MNHTKEQDHMDNMASGSSHHWKSFGRYTGITGIRHGIRNAYRRIIEKYFPEDDDDCCVDEWGFFGDDALRTMGESELVGVASSTPSAQESAEAWGLATIRAADRVSKPYD